MKTDGTYLDQMGQMIIASAVLRQSLALPNNGYILSSA